MSTYDLWKASVQLAEDATTEAERTHHYAVAGVLRGDAIKDYFRHIAGELYDPSEEVVDSPDNAQVSKFLADLDAIREPAKPVLQDKLSVAALDALKAMEHLNYTGEHTHFEVLADARQVLAAVMLGKPMPQLERFRCPSLLNPSSPDAQAGPRCRQQLPHDGKHQWQGTDGKGVSWADEDSANPPTSYDDRPVFTTGGMIPAPEPIAVVDKIGVREDGTGAHCGVLATVDAKTVACMEPIGSVHHIHRSAGGRLYVIRGQETL